MKTAVSPTVGAVTEDVPERSTSSSSEFTEDETKTIKWQQADGPFILQCYKDLCMERMVPRFQDWLPSDKLVLSVEDIPNPREVSTTHPDNIDLIFETPGVEPTLGWPYYVRGVAAASLIVARDWYPAIKEAVCLAAESVIAGYSLPPMDGDFSVYVAQGERVIFCNGEHSSWRPMLAFMQGAFWVLSFVKKPTKRRGNYSPLEFVNGMVRYYGALGYVPQ